MENRKNNNIRGEMYQPQIETASREVLQAMQLRLLQNQLSYVYEHSPMYRRKYDEVGLKPGDIKTLSDISKIPFTTKEDLRKSQEENPLFGDFLCVPPHEGVRVFKTTGTTGEPLKVILTPKDWFSTTSEQVAFAAYAFGLRKSEYRISAVWLLHCDCLLGMASGAGKFGINSCPWGCAKFKGTNKEYHRVASNIRLWNTHLHSSFRKYCQRNGN